MYTAETIVRLRGAGPDGQEHVVELPIAGNLTYEQLMRVAHARTDGGRPQLENALCDEELLGWACRLREAEERLVEMCATEAT